MTTSGVVEETAAEAASAVEQTSTPARDLEIPLSYDEMIAMAARCMADAYAQGTTRQIVRILLPRSPDGERLGEMYEADATDMSMQEAKLVPCDESWQGGIEQLYRAAAPAARDLLRRLSATTGGVPPRVVEDRAVDPSGVDGVGLVYTRSGTTGSDGDGTATAADGGGEEGGFSGLFRAAAALPDLAAGEAGVFVQPSQEVAADIDALSTRTAASDLVALLNPQWRDVDDALDSASKSGGLVGAFASFLGGKGSVLRRLDELGYRPTFTLEGYVCRGGNVRLIKRFDSDWAVFAENDSGDRYVRVGERTTRPTYQDVEAMLDDKGVGYKYARDLGMAPKL